MTNIRIAVIIVVTILAGCAAAYSQEIVFLQPKTLKVNTESVEVKGTVMDSDVPDIDIAAINILSLIKDIDKQGESDKKKNFGWLDMLSFETITVTNGFFRKTFTIEEGINAIIAKPSQAVPSRKNTFLKVIVHDRITPVIELSQPLSDRIAELRQVSGRIKGKSRKTVKVILETLSSVENDSDKPYRLNRLMELDAPVKGGKFSVSIPVQEYFTGNEIAILTIIADKEYMMKTFF